MYTHATARLLAEASGAVKDSPLYDQIGGTASDLAAVETTIRGRAADIRGVLDRIEQRLDSTALPTARLNDLGELQRTGQDYDAAIIRFAGLERQLAILLDLAKKA